MIESYTEERHEFGERDVESPKPGVMQVYYENGKPVMVNFLCPCGCGSDCVTLLSGKYPRQWVWTPGPTLTPDIRYLSGCKSHFNITGGKVIMHSDSGI